MGFCICFLQKQHIAERHQQYVGCHPLKNLIKNNGLGRILFYLQCFCAPWQIALGVDMACGIIAPLSAAQAMERVPGFTGRDQAVSWGGSRCRGELGNWVYFSYTKQGYLVFLNFE